MKRMQKGFTLIELMIVVAIIGILAAVAIPQYQDYTVKAKLSKVSAFADPIKTALGLYNQENGSFPSTASAWTSLGMSAAPATTTEVSAATITASTGEIVLTLQGIRAVGIDGTTISMLPTVGSTAISWTNTCTSTDPIIKKYYSC